MSATLTMKRRLTVAMIVRDAASRLHESIESIRSIADEILIADAGSTDQTLDVVRRHGVEPFEVEWNDDFSTARNECMRRASGDWILWLDAGERIDRRSAAELRDFIDRQADANTAYMMLVQVPPSLGGGSVEQAGRIRLIPRRDGIGFRGRVRESLAESLAAMGIQIDGLPWRIVRGEHVRLPATVATKARRDLRLADLAIVDDGPKSEWLLARGEALSALGDQIEAADVLRQAIASAEPSSRTMLEAYYGLLTAIEGDMSCDAATRRQRQIEVAVAALQVFPLDVQLLTAMGSYLQAQGKLALAERSFSLAWRHGQAHPEVWHLADIHVVAAACWSLTLQLQGKDDESLAALEAALARWPDASSLRRQLLHLHIKHARRDEALAQLDMPGIEAAGKESLRTAVRGACLAAEKNWIAAHSYLEMAYRAGCRDPICLRAYALSLAALERLGEAESIFEQWHQIRPDDPEPRQYLQAIAQSRQASTSGQAAPATDEPTKDQRRVRVDQGESIVAAAPLETHVDGAPAAANLSSSESK